MTRSECLYGREPRFSVHISGAAKRPEEGHLFAAYQEEAREGHSIVAVHTHEQRDIEEAREILVQHGAHHIEMFGHGGFIRTLSEEQSKS